MSDKPRVRFAPSPTGSLHVGGARTALYNWLYARKTGGVFVLRIEDTDTTRSTADSVRGILDGLTWLGLDWDEGPGAGGEYGPYFQSERVDIYGAEARRLLAEGRAYPCFCDDEATEKHRTQAGYDGHCRRLPDDEVSARLKAGQPHALRFRAPGDGEITLYDLVRGKTVFQAGLFEDFIILKSDGMASYNFAVVVDDNAMAITHVIRGDDHISNTPRHLMLYEALGYKLPKFAHLPMILGEDKARLSKRHGASSITDFAVQDILPEGLMNYLALLGWSLDGKTEFFTPRKLIEAFSLKRVGSTPSVFDPDKLRWLSEEHFKKLPLERRVEGAWQTLTRHGFQLAPLADCRDELQGFVELVGNRIKSFGEALWALDPFFRDSPVYDEDAVGEHLGTEAAAQLSALAGSWEELEPFSAEVLEARLREQAESLGLGAGDLIHMLRVAVTGRGKSPDIFRACALLGRDRTLSRLRSRAWESTGA